MPGELNRQLIIRTKLQRPRLAEDLVARPQLLARLHRGLDRKLTLISAQAGAGKSTLLAQWLADVEPTRRSAWLSLDEHDNDLLLFVSYLCEAIRTAFPDACDQTLRLLDAPQTPPVRVIVSSLVNELDALAGNGGHSGNGGRSAKGVAPFNVYFFNVMFSMNIRRGGGGEPFAHYISCRFFHRMAIQAGKAA